MAYLFFAIYIILGLAMFQQVLFSLTKNWTHTYGMPLGEYFKKIGLATVQFLKEIFTPWRV